MNTIMAKSSPDFSSKRHFHWKRKVGTEDEVNFTASSAPNFKSSDEKESVEQKPQPVLVPKKKLSAVTVARVRSVISMLSHGKNRSTVPLGLGHKVVGTLFGYRRGHVHFAFQRDPASQPAFLIELATPISGLVKEMASGLVRIALECTKEEEDNKKEEKRPAVRLLEESLWRTYCNGKKCGFATRRECGSKEWKVLKAVEPISMGAGVLPAGDGTEGETDGEIMYMRAKFERIVGSRDSEAFYMMNPDSNGAPELSIYLLRV